MEDYKELLGQCVDVELGEEIVDGIIVGIDKDIGITVTDYETQKRNLFCISTLYQGNGYRGIPYEDLWDFHVISLGFGFVSLPLFEDVLTKQAGLIDPMCAFI